MSSPNQPLVLIDGGFISYRAFHSMGHLSHEGNPTGVLYEVLRAVKDIGTRLRTNQVVFCWDSRTNHRKELDPAYKGNRKPSTPEEAASRAVLYKQIDQMATEVMFDVGFSNSFRVKGLEADDIIAHLAHSHCVGKTYIVSADSDLYQLLAENVVIYNPMRKKPFYTRKDFVTEYGIEPSEWATVKAIAGDTADNVPGASGVGPATAIKYLKESMNPKTETYQKITTFLMTQRFEDNLNLVSLPWYKNAPDADAISIEPNQFEWDAFVDVCERFGFKSFLRTPFDEEWDEFFCGEFDPAVPPASASPIAPIKRRK